MTIRAGTETVRASPTTLQCREGGADTRTAAVPEGTNSKDAMSFYCDLSTRKNLPSWKDMKAVQPQLHEYLLEEMCDQETSLKDKSCNTPDGILSHGGQGTGKSVFVEVFCQSFNIQLYKLDASVKQSLVGQSEE